MNRCALYKVPLWRSRWRHDLDHGTDRSFKRYLAYVNCKQGTTFLSSKDSSAEARTGENIFKYVLSAITEIVIQVVTDNASNNMAAVKMLKAKMPSIFWSLCATHTINLMLEGIDKLPKFKNTLEKAKEFHYLHLCPPHDIGVNEGIYKEEGHVTWWTNYGSETPNLQTIAKNILSLTSSSSGCERNQNMFEGTCLREPVSGLDDGEMRDLGDDFQFDNEAVEENVEFESDDDVVFQLEEYVVEGKSLEYQS
ncbi:hypothetical protein Ddye_027155 [Dipteronia dyeriana]|uniref:DUF659 domain-containing protein n=1 Tax=Dipteronia dyeriana TaxID=168575 RepID=A0AAD9WR75_9ROSI|nr:hypothetical protein Ddye_027155 [Dipteronia dyeriana]